MPMGSGTAPSVVPQSMLSTVLARSPSAFWFPSSAHSHMFVPSFYASRSPTSSRSAMYLPAFYMPPIAPSARSSSFSPSFYSSSLAHISMPTPAFFPLERSSIGPRSAMSSPWSQMSNTQPYMINSLTPVSVDFPSLNYAPNHGQRSTTGKA